MKRRRRFEEDGKMDLSSSEDRGYPNRWLPARQSLAGTRMFIPALGSGNGRGLIHETWTTEQLLCCLNKWARLFRTAESDAEMEEGVHYEFTDWKPTSILFARGKRNPILGMRRDDAWSLKATKILLHVGEVNAVGLHNPRTYIEDGALSNKWIRQLDEF